MKGLCITRRWSGHGCSESRRMVCMMVHPECISKIHRSNFTPFGRGLESVDDSLGAKDCASSGDLLTMSSMHLRRNSCCTRPTRLVYNLTWSGGPSFVYFCDLTTQIGNEMRPPGRPRSSKSILIVCAALTTWGTSATTNLQHLFQALKHANKEYHTSPFRHPSP